MNVMMNILKLAYKCAVRTLPPEPSLMLQFFRFHHKFPRLKNPRTFSEKIQYRKLHERNPRFCVLADKARVKEEIARIVGQRFIIPSLWSGPCLPPVEERIWPAPFVLKANNASKRNLFVRSEEEKDWPMIEETCRQWLSTGVANFWQENWYNEIERQIVVEPMLGDRSPGASLVDYQFFVFGGRAEYVQVDIGENGHYKRTLFDRNWTRQPFGLKFQIETREIERPPHFTEMLKAAEKIASEFSFARVDFYDFESGPKFGEVTFAPSSGYSPFHPSSYDRVFGDLWKYERN